MSLDIYSVLSLSPNLTIRSVCWTESIARTDIIEQIRCHSRGARLELSQTMLSLPYALREIGWCDIGGRRMGEAKR